MNNEILTVLENCKDYIEQIKDDALAKYLVKEINHVIKNEIQNDQFNNRNFIFGYFSLNIKINVNLTGV